MPRHAPDVAPEGDHVPGDIDLVLVYVLALHRPLVELLQHGGLATKPGRGRDEQVGSWLRRWRSKLFVKPCHVLQIKAPQLVQACAPPPSTRCATVITGDGTDNRAVRKPDFVSGGLYDTGRKTGILLAQSKGGSEHPAGCLLDVVGNGEALDTGMRNALVDQHATGDEGLARLFDLRVEPCGVVALVHCL